MWLSGRVNLADLRIQLAFRRGDRRAFSNATMPASYHLRASVSDYRRDRKLIENWRGEVYGY